MKSFLSLIVVLSLIASTWASKPPYGTMVHLFEWKWPDVARECEDFLASAGYSAIQISPPHEHVQGFQWWTRYQPVSYKLQSRGGSREQFIDMVRRCNAVGVDIYVDAVINHMSGVGSGTGVGGSSYSEHRYPGVPYSATDFHFCGRNGNNDIRNYNDAFEVRNCELVNLADLKMEISYVRDRIADYLNDLISIGVRGFRYDAAKHMAVDDLNAIRGRLRGNPYIFSEVIDQSSSEAIRASEYFGVGDVTEFKYGFEVANNVRGRGKMRFFSNFGEAFGLMRSDKAVVFISNHDNERGHGGGGSVLTFNEQGLHEVASVLMLAWPYGYPKVMSSFAFFGDFNRGPPGSSPFNGCGYGREWICQHRARPIAGMVRVRKVAANAPVTKFSFRGDTIAFSRGANAFIAINREEFGVDHTFDTDLPPGEYCNVLEHEFKNGGCTGPTTSVGADGRVRVGLGGLKSMALHIEAKIGSSPSGFKSVFNSMFLRGSFNSWGTLSMELAADNTWVARDVSFTGNSNPRFKFDVNGDWQNSFGDNNSDGIADGSGRDIPVGSATGMKTITFNDATLRYSVL